MSNCKPQLECTLGIQVTPVKTTVDILKRRAAEPKEANAGCAFLHPTAIQ